MTATRSRKQVKTYDRHLKYVEPPAKGCVFCTISDKDPQFVKQTAFFKVISNIFPYSLWDSQPVEDHLLLIPHIHTDTLADLPSEAAQEFVKVISSYESAGYSIYARAPGSTMKSLVHQHTHLIKTRSRNVRGVFYVRKPYIRLLIK